VSEAIKKLYRFGNSWTGTIIIVLVVIFFFAQAFKIPSGSMLPTLLIGDHLFVKKFAYGVPTPHIPFVEIPIMPDFNHNGHIVTASGPKRGDIVVFRPPFNEKIHYVKRNVAVGGDEVMVHNGTLYLAPKNGDEDIKANFNEYEIVNIGGKNWVKNPYAKEFPGIHNDMPKLTSDAFLQEMTDVNLYYETHKNDKDAFGVDFFAPSEPLTDKRYFFGPYVVPENEYFMMGDNRDHSQDSRYFGSVAYRLIVGQPWFVYFSWDDDYLVRWDRIGKSVNELERSITPPPNGLKL
jgi:signal peptidase I